MHGNVWEWVQDWYGNYPPGPVTDPKNSSFGKERVIRGGSWGASARHLRSTDRWSKFPFTNYLNYIGFRVAKSL